MRTNHAVAFTCAALSLTAGAAATAGAPTVARWAAPVSGSFTSPANWVDGIRPGVEIGAVIDAAGAPYTVSLQVGFGSLFVQSLTLDSADATFRLNPISNQGLVLWNLAALRGTIESDRSFMRLSGKREFDLGPGAALRVLEAGQTGADRGYLALTGGVQMRNAGVVELGRNTRFEAPQSDIGTPRESSMVNEETGLVRSNAAFLMTFNSLTNRGLMEFHDRPADESGLDAATLVSGGFGPFGERAALMNHSGEIRLLDADVRLLAELDSSGLFHVDATSTLAFSPEILPSDAPPTPIRFNPGTRFEGGGQVFIQSRDIAGDIHADNDLTIHGTLVGSIFNSGTTTLRGFFGSTPIESELHTLSSGGQISLLLGAPGIAIRDDLIVSGGLETLLTSGVTTATISVGGDTHLAGDIDLTATALTTGADLTIAPGAVITTTRDITVGGNLTSGALDTSAAFIVTGDADVMGNARVRQWRVAGVTTTDSDLTATQGTSTLSDGSTIGGTLAAPSVSIQGSVAIGSFATAPSTTITLDGELTLTSDTALTTSRIVLATLPGNWSDPTSRIHADVALTRPANPFLPSFQSSVSFTDNNSRSLEILGALSVEGLLAITFLGGVSDAYLGQSFTLIHATEGLTGQFDPLTLPSLANGLSFDLIYDANSLRLVVVSAPGASFALLAASLITLRRRRVR